jgi:hypothetical protein
VRTVRSGLVSTATRLLGSSVCRCGRCRRTGSTPAASVAAVQRAVAAAQAKKAPLVLYPCGPPLRLGGLTVPSVSRGAQVAPGTRRAVPLGGARLASKVRTRTPEASQELLGGAATVLRQYPEKFSNLSVCYTHTLLGRGMRAPRAVNQVSEHLAPGMPSMRSSQRQHPSL